MTLNSTNNALLRICFENEVCKRNGQSFEDLFVSIMRAYDNDFIAVKTYGNLGDRKNDGFNKSTGTYYQVYAPESITSDNTIQKAVNKLDVDFKGLLEHWDRICRVNEFNFVINDKFSEIPLPLVQKIVELNNDYPSIKIEIFDTEKLWGIFCSLNASSIKTIIPSIPDSILYDNNEFMTEKIAIHAHEIGNSVIDSSIKQIEIWDDYLRILFPGILIEPERDDLLTLDEILNDKNNIQIIGPSGSGKTVLASKTYMNLINDSNKKRVPLFLNTYGYDSSHSNYLYYQIIRSYVRPTSIENNSIERLKNLLENEKGYEFIVFIDGINESSSMLEGDLIKEINELSSYPCCKVVVLVRNEIPFLEPFENYYVNEVPEKLVYQRIRSYYNLPYETKRILRRPLFIEAYKEVYTDPSSDKGKDITEADILFTFYKSRIEKLGTSKYAVAKNEYLGYVKVVIFNYLPLLCWTISRSEQISNKCSEEFFDSVWNEWYRKLGISKQTAVRDTLGFRYITVLKDMNLIHIEKSGYFQDYYYPDQFVIDFFCAFFIANNLLSVDVNELFDIKQNDSLCKYIAGFCDNDDSKTLFAALRTNEGKINDQAATTNKNIISCIKYCKSSLSSRNFNSLDLSMVCFTEEDWHDSTFVGSFISLKNLFPKDLIPGKPIVAVCADRDDQCVYMLEMGGYVYKYSLRDKEFIDKSTVRLERPECYQLGVPSHNCIRMVSNSKQYGDNSITVIEYSFLTKEKREIMTIKNFGCRVLSNNGNWIVADDNDAMLVINVNTGRIKAQLSDSMFPNGISTVSISNDGRLLFVTDSFWMGYVCDLDIDQYVECHLNVLSKTVFVDDFGIVLFDMNAGVHTAVNKTNLMHTDFVIIGRLSNQFGVGCYPPCGDMTVVKIDTKLYAIWTQLMKSVVYMQEIGINTKMDTLIDNSDIPLLNQQILLSWDCKKIAISSFDQYLRVFSIDENRITNAFKLEDAGFFNKIRWSKCGNYLGVLSTNQLIVFNTKDNTYESIEENLDSFEFFECQHGWGIVGYRQPLSVSLSKINARVISREENSEDQDMGTFVVYYSEDKYKKQMKSKEYVFDQLLRFEDGIIGAINWNDLKCTFIDYWDEKEPPVSLCLPQEMAIYKDFASSQSYYNQPVCPQINDGVIELINQNFETQSIEGIQYGINILNCNFSGCKFDHEAPNDELIQKIFINGGKYQKEKEGIK